MIERLTEEQKSKFTEYIKKWIDIGLSTHNEINKKAATKAICALYKAGGLKAPRLFIFLGSPWAGMLGANIVQGYKVYPVRDQVQSRVWDQVMTHVMAQVSERVWAQVMTQVRKQVQSRVPVREQVQEQVMAQVRDQVGNQVRALVAKQVWEQVWEQVWDQLMTHVMATMRDQVGNQVQDQPLKLEYPANYGSHEAGWLSFYDYVMTEVINTDNKLTSLIEVAKTCGWCWLYENIAIVTPKPSAIQRDDENRLHCETGAAVAYPDGFGVYAWHGVRVNKDIIEHSEAITKEDILKENNQEIKRVMITRYGWDKFLSDMNAVTINEDKFGKLISTDKLKEYLQGEDDIAMFVLVKDPSTDRKYTLRVPPNMTTAHDAVAWTFDVTPDLYYPTQET